MSSHNYCESLWSIMFLHFKITMCCHCDFPNLHCIIALSRKEEANNDKNWHHCLQFSNLMAHLVLMSSFFSHFYFFATSWIWGIFLFHIQCLNLMVKTKAWYWHIPNAYTKVTEWLSVNELRPVHLQLTCSQQRVQRQPLQKMMIRKVGISMQKVNVIPS